MKRRIEVLVFDGCPSGIAALDMAREVLEEVGIDAEIQLVDVESDVTAELLGFVGSPSIRVDGIDIEPSRRNEKGHNLSCRVYRTSSGFQGLPPRGLLIDALNEVGPDN